MVTATERLMREDLDRSGVTNSSIIKKLQLKALEADAVAKLTKGAFDFPAYRIPYFDFDGKLTGYYRLRLLNGADPNGTYKGAADAPPIRYWQPAGSKPQLYTPPLLDWREIADDVRIRTTITEGEKKSIAACLEGIPCLGIGGVWSFKSKKWRCNLIPDLKAFKWLGRIVELCMDSDVANRSDLLAALDVLARELTQPGARVFNILLPSLSLTNKTGLDDWILAGNTKDDYEAFAREMFDYGSELYEFNKEFALLRTPVGRVVRLKDNDVMIVADLQIDTNDRRIKKLNAAGNEMSVRTCDEWLAWPLRKTFKRLTYAPRPIRAETDLGDGTRNTWRGWATTDTKRVSVKPFLDLVENICKGNSFSDGSGGEQAAMDWLLKWLAYPIRRPGTKMRTAVVLRSHKQGTGKTLLGYTMRECIYGRENVSEIGQDDLKSEFNGWRAHKQLILGEEVAALDKRKDRDRIKAFITADTFQVNIKHKPPYDLDDCANFIFTSNNPDPLSFDEQDRRFCVLEILEKLTEAFWTKYGNWYVSDEAKLGMMNFMLNEIDITDFNPNAEAPMTSAKAESIRLQRSDETDWVREQVVGNYDNTFSLTKCDFQTAQQIATLYNQRRVNGQKWLSPIMVGRILARVDSKQVVKLDQFTDAKGNSIRAYALRNLEKWKRAKAAEIQEHWDSTRSLGEVSELDAARERKQKFQK
jgi:hypothetical protein